MLNWKPFTGNSYDWDNITKQFKENDFRQSFAWGEHLKYIGWKVERKQLIKDNYTNLIQYSLKKKWPIIAVYITGIDSNNLKYLSLLIDDLKYEYRNYFMYIRFDSHNKKSCESLSSLKFLKFKKTIYSIRERHHSFVNLNNSHDEILKSTKQKWRYNLKKAQKKPVVIEVVDQIDPDEIWNLSKDLSNFKNIKNLYTYKELESYKKYLKEITLIVRAKNMKNQIVGYYICTIFNFNSFQIFNAVNKEGNSLLAGYATLMFIISELKKLGIQNLYLGELNKKRYPGNFQFKSSFNQKKFEVIGEYEYSSNLLIRLLFNFYLYIRNA